MTFEEFEKTFSDEEQKNFVIYLMQTEWDELEEQLDLAKPKPFTKENYEDLSKRLENYGFELWAEDSFSQLKDKELATIYSGDIGKVNDGGFKPSQFNPKYLNGLIEVGKMDSLSLHSWTTDYIRLDIVITDDNIEMIPVVPNGCLYEHLREDFDEPDAGRPFNGFKEKDIRDILDRINDDRIEINDVFKDIYEKEFETAKDIDEEWGQDEVTEDR